MMVSVAIQFSFFINLIIFSFHSDQCSGCIDTNKFGQILWIVFILFLFQNFQSLFQCLERFFLCVLLEDSSNSQLVFSRFTFLIGSFPSFSFSVLVSSVYSAHFRFFLRLYFFRYPLSYWIPENFPHLDVFLPSTFPHDWLHFAHMNYL